MKFPTRLFMGIVTNHDIRILRIPSLTNQDDSWKVSGRVFFAFQFESSLTKTEVLIKRCLENLQVTSWDQPDYVSWLFRVYKYINKGL